MKISIVNRSDAAGGAARAAYRMHSALRRAGVDSRMEVNLATSGDWTVRGPTGAAGRMQSRLRTYFGYQINRLQRTGNPILHSTAWLPSGWPERLNSSDADLVNLVWVNDEMLSVEDIAKIRKPVVWTLQDMWAICGAEHVGLDRRYIEGYTKANRPVGESGLDLNRLTWQRKRSNWRRPMQIVTPSRWMADCVRQSALMRDWPVSFIVNPIDTDRWYPVDKKLARSLLQLPDDVPLLLFGTAGTNDAPHKGFDLLRQALSHLSGQAGLHLVIFGQPAPKDPPDFGFPAHYSGYLHDDLSMQILYSAVDLVAIPSRVDNLPNVGVEAIACGTPVVAFDTCGLPDIVRHRETGYLAKAFEPEDFARGIQWALADEARHASLCRAARLDAENRFSYPVVARQYLSVYNGVLGA